MCSKQVCHFLWQWGRCCSNSGARVFSWTPRRSLKWWYLCRQTEYSFLSSHYLYTSLCSLTGKQRQLWKWNDLENVQTLFKLTIDADISEDSNSAKIHIPQANVCHPFSHLKHTHNCSSPCPGTDKSPSTARQTRCSSYPLPTGPNVQGHLCPGFQSRRIWLAFWKQGDLGQSEATLSYTVGLKQAWATSQAHVSK